MNIFVDDVSPQVAYYSNGGVGWVFNHSNGQKYPDSKPAEYLRGTFHATFTDGDRMEYRFNGSGVALYGAKRDNHGLLTGLFTIIVDGGDELFIDGFNQEALFQQQLFVRTGLDTSKEHVIIVTNHPTITSGAATGTNDRWLDIDGIVVTQPVDGTLYTTHIDDTSPAVTYDSSWAPYGSGTAAYFNLTNHLNSVQNSVMELKFTGSSIQMFAAVGPDHSNYTVSLDGGEAQIYNASFWSLVYQVPRFTASGLSEGEHSVRIVNTGGSATNAISFDYAVVNSTINPDASSHATTTGGTSGTTTSLDGTADGDAITVTEYRSASTAVAGSASLTGSNAAASGTVTAGAITASEGKTTNVAAISGGVAGGVVSLALGIVVLIWWLRRRRTHDPRVQSFYSQGGGNYGPSADPQNPSRRIDVAAANSPGFSPGPKSGWSGGPVTPFLNWRSTSSFSASGSPEPTPTFTPRESSPFLTGVPPPPESTTSSFPRSTYAPSAAASPARRGDAPDVPVPAVPVAPSSASAYSQAGQTYATHEPRGGGGGGLETIYASTDGSSGAEAVHHSHSGSSDLTRLSTDQAVPAGGTGGEKRSWSQQPNQSSLVQPRGYAASPGPQLPAIASTENLSDLYWQRASGVSGAGEPGRDGSVHESVRGSVHGSLHPRDSGYGGMEAHGLPPNYHLATQPLPGQTPE
ncbi:hypothetical protein IAT38_001054 [Cryptococcus sp. DSM 104549]